MFEFSCSRCGNDLNDGEFYCDNCHEYHCECCISEKNICLCEMCAEGDEE